MNDFARPEIPPAEWPASERLESWKQIAAYLKRDVRTVQRWEKREGLPVYRHMHDKLGTAYAYKPELDAWWNHRRPALEQQVVALASGRRPGRWLAAGGAIVVLAAALVAWPSYRRATGGAKRGEMVARRLWGNADPGRMGSASPDGRFCSYTDAASGDLAVWDVAAGKATRLTAGQPRAKWEGASSSAFSPDGKQIAYSWVNQDYLCDLRLIGSDGSGYRLLYRDASVFRIDVSDWSPDGRHVLVTLSGKDRANRIVLVSIADGSVRALKDLGWRAPLKMKFSPDGRYIVYDFPPREDSPDLDVFLMATSSAGDSAREIPLVEHQGNDFVLGWAPDGKTVLFGSDRTGTVDAWVIPVAGGKPQGPPALVRKDLGRVWPVGFTKRGAYYYGLQTGLADVYVAELDPATARLAAAPKPVAQRWVGFSRSPDWSPDGRYLAYVPHPAPMQPTSRVIIRSVDGGQERELRPKLRHVELLRWSPDGRFFITTGEDKKGRSGVFRVDAQTGEAATLVQSSDPKAFFVEAACARGGQTLFYKVRNWFAEPSPLMTLDLESGVEKEFLSGVYRFALSRDGRQVAFSTPRQAGGHSLMVMPAAGGEAREVCRMPGQIVSIAWTPDGRRLLFARRGELWSVAVERGEPEKVGPVMEDLREIRLAPDGRHMAFTAGTGRGEMWTMENFLPAGSN